MHLLYMNDNLLHYSIYQSWSHYKFLFVCQPPKCQLKTFDIVPTAHLSALTHGSLAIKTLATRCALTPHIGLSSARKIFEVFLLKRLLDHVTVNRLQSLHAVDLLNGRVKG